MFAGLVFTPLSLVQAATKFMFISDEMLNSSVEIVKPHAYRHQQSVVVSDILPHEMNQGHREQIAPHPLARLRFEGCRVSASSMIGKPGEGFRIAMATLDVFRCTVGAAALGFARRALEEASSRAANRHLFGAPLGSLQMVQGHLADMAVDVDASALLVYRAAWTKDQGAARVTREAAMAKLFATEAAQRVIDAAVQLHGGDGVRSGHPVEKLYREIRALRIYEGASDVQKVVIARSL
jgi:acyl-CoA dehydrogenase